jgi:hypothetical protein
VADESLGDVAVTPWEEVRSTGRIGHEGAKLLYRLVYSVAIDRNIPAPAGHFGWGKAAIEETAHDFVSGPAGMDRLVTMATQATDDDSFRRQFAAAVHNYLRTLGRATDLGKLIVRLTDILTTTADFEPVHHGTGTTWTTAGGSVEPSQIFSTDLEPAIRTIRVERPSWTSETRDAPLADRRTLVEMMNRILTAAGGTMSVRDIAEVVAARIDIRRIPRSWELDDPDTTFEPAERDDAASVTLDALHVRDFFGGLTDRERIMVAFSDKSVRELGPIVGLRHAQAAIVRQRLFDRIRDEFAEIEDPEDVIEILCDLCEAWVTDWTDGDGPTL